MVEDDGFVVFVLGFFAVVVNAHRAGGIRMGRILVAGHGTREGARVHLVWGELDRRVQTASSQPIQVAEDCVGQDCERDCLDAGVLNVHGEGDLTGRVDHDAGRGRLGHVDGGVRVIGERALPDFTAADGHRLLIAGSAQRNPGFFRSQRTTGGHQAPAVRRPLGDGVRSGIDHEVIGQATGQGETAAGEQACVGSYFEREILIGFDRCEFLDDQGAGPVIVGDDASLSLTVVDLDAGTVVVAGEVTRHGRFDDAVDAGVHR